MAERIIRVTKCADCPFMTYGRIFVAVCTKGEALTPVHDTSEIPDWCPLEREVSNG